MLGAVCRHWHEREEAVRELRSLVAVTGTEASTDGVDDTYLRDVVKGLAAAGHLRPRWSPDDAVDALVLPDVVSRLRTAARERPRGPAKIEALLAKLAVSIVSPNVVNATG